MLPLVWKMSKTIQYFVLTSPILGKHSEKICIALSWAAVIVKTLEVKGCPGKYGHKIIQLSVHNVAGTINIVNFSAAAMYCILNLGKMMRGIYM